MKTPPIGKMSDNDEIDSIIEMFSYPGLQIEWVRIEELFKHRCQLCKPGTNIKKLRGQRAFDNARCPNHTITNISIEGKNPMWICADHVEMLVKKWKERTEKKDDR